MKVRLTRISRLSIGAFLAISLNSIHKKIGKNQLNGIETRKSRLSIGNLLSVSMNGHNNLLMQFLLREYLANNPEYRVANNNCQGNIFFRCAPY